MTREEIMALDMEGLEERASAIEVETREADKETIEALTAEMDAIEERKKVIEAEAEEKRAAMEAVIDGEGEEVETPKEEKEERKMDSKETRNSVEYKKAFGEYLKAGYDLDKMNEEQRALLTVNAEENGTIAVPVGVQQAINTAWESNEIMRRVVRTFFKGNLKVGYEKSASGAVIHKEGSEPVQPENLVIEYVELIPEMVKKLVEVSDEVLANNEAMVDYLYDEIEYQLVKLTADNVVADIIASNLTQSFTMAGANPTAADIIGAAGLLGGEATNPVVITTRATAAAIKAAALSAHYGYDPFDGMEVLYTNQAALGTAAFIVADLSGVQANFPEGDEAKFKFDDLTKADEDLVRIVGRLYAGIGVVAAGKTVKAVTA